MTIPATVWYLAHLPHLAPVLVAFVAVAWGFYRNFTQPPPGHQDPDGWLAERDTRMRERRARKLREAVARRGLFALGPLAAALATGAVIYGIDIAGDRPGAALAWTHAGVATLATLLVAYKLAEVGLGRIRDGLRPGVVLETSLSVLLLALFPPLLITGVVLLFSPSSASFSAYAHLVASAWWTVLLVAHLARYLRGSLSAAALPRPASARSGSRPRSGSARAAG